MAELRHRATPDLELRSDGDGRTVYGILAPFGQTARVVDGRGPSTSRTRPARRTGRHAGLRSALRRLDSVVNAHRRELLGRLPPLLVHTP